jgi:predicted RNase H-like HicB family nuclease
MKQFKIVVEKHPDTYVAYPLGLKGIVVGQVDSYEAALSDVRSAIQFHIDTFGTDAVDIEPPVSLIKQLAGANLCGVRKSSFSFLTTQSFPGSSDS